MNIDTFLERYNEIGEAAVQRTDLTCLEKENELIYFFQNEDVFLSVTTDKSSGFIKKADIVSETVSEIYTAFIERVLKALCDDEAAEKAKGIIAEENNTEIQRKGDHSQNYTLTFFKIKEGCKCTVIFNELIKYETTSVPESQSYTYTVIEESKKN